MVEEYDINKFLTMRDNRLDEIEIANKLYIEIGNFLTSTTRSEFSSDAYTDGCIYQFFAYTQTRILVHFIFSNFITIIGNYHAKKDCLKSWEKFELTEETISFLKAIRARYSEVRNNLLAHLSVSFKPNEAHAVPTVQIEEDIKRLRDILNIVRKLNQIPILIKGYDTDKQYAVEGIRKLFEQLGLRSLDTNIILRSS